MPESVNTGYSTDCCGQGKKGPEVNKQTLRALTPALEIIFFGTIVYSVLHYLLMLIQSFVRLLKEVNVVYEGVWRHKLKKPRLGAASRLYSHGKPWTRFLLEILAFASLFKHAANRRDGEGKEAELCFKNITTRTMHIFRSSSKSSEYQHTQLNREQGSKNHDE